MAIKDKKILISAGPTWVPIDSARVISNIATGQTGILLAESLQRLGAKVTLLLGPAGLCCLNKKIRLLRFRFFDELREIIKRELKSRRYDIVIHSAAVSDYRSKISYRQKVKSGKKNWQINLVPAAKIINSIKRINKNIFLVGFKFEPGADRAKLLSRAKGLIDKANLDLAVANSITKNSYTAYIINAKDYGPFSDRRSLVENLVKIIGENLCRN